VEDDLAAGAVLVQVFDPPVHVVVAGGAHDLADRVAAVLAFDVRDNAS
jgi:hypothetical protein